MLGNELQTSFRAVPDGQYTQTIYSLIRDQKYMEVSIESIKNSKFGVLRTLFLRW